MLFLEDGKERYGSHNDTNVFKHRYLKKKKKVFPGGSEVKNLPVNARDTRDPGSVPWWKISWRRKWQLTPVFLPGIFHGQ